MTTEASPDGLSGDRPRTQALLDWASRHRWRIGWALFGVGVVLLVVASQADDDYWQGLLVNLGTGLLLFLPLLVVGQLFERQVERRVEDEVADAVSTVHEATEVMGGLGTSEQPTQGRTAKEGLQYEADVQAALRRVASRLRPQASVAVEWPVPGRHADGILRWRGQAAAIEAKRSVGGLPLSSRRLHEARAQPGSTDRLR